MDYLGILWGLLGGGFNWWLTLKLFSAPSSSRRTIVMVIVKPLVHLVVLGAAAFVSKGFLLFAAGGDLAMLAAMFIKNYIDGRR